MVITQILLRLELRGKLLGADADADARGGAGGDTEYGGESGWDCRAVADGLAGAADGKFRRAD